MIPLRRLVFACFLCNLISLVGGVSHAQERAPIVTGLHRNGPALPGRFVSIDCMLHNTASTPITLDGLGLVPVDETDGAGSYEKVVPVGTLTPVFPVRLKPGQKFTVRRFYRPDRPGKQRAAIVARCNGRGWARLSDKTGRDAVVSLLVRLPESIPRMNLDVADAHPNHRYRAGETIALRVTPVVTGGDDLAESVAGITVVPGAKPFSISDTGRATELLRKGDRPALRVDFYGVEEVRKFMEFDVSLRQPVELSSVRLTGENLNGEYDITACEVEATRPDGGVVAIPAVILRHGYAWEVNAGLGKSVTAASLRLRVRTPYELDITSLAMQGSATAGDKRSLEPGIAYRWQDAHGAPLSGWRPLDPRHPSDIRFPRTSSPGYYGLIVRAEPAGEDVTTREYGFAVFRKSTPARAKIRDERLAVIHADENDDELGTAWSKTLSLQFFDSATRKLDAAAWRAAIADRRAHGLTDLPLAIGEDWVSDGAKPVSAEQLQRLHHRMLQYFRAEPSVPAWELGIEENLGWRAHRGDWPYYWQNLEAKAKAVRRAADEVDPKIKLIYQVAELDIRSVEDFCRSAAAAQFDVLALHPYAWPDFPPPARWMPDYVGRVRALMRRCHSEKPIWFTEIGAPLDGNPRGFFGYPTIPAFDRGLGRDEHGAYLAQCILEAFRLGIEKVFWYTYSDSGDNPEYAEDFFGMIDARGFPKPSYLAFCTLSNQIAGRSFASMKILPGGVRVYRFSGKEEDCLAIWTSSGGTPKIDLRSLDLGSRTVRSVADAFGRPLSMGKTLAAGKYPLYVSVTHQLRKAAK